MLRTRLLGVVSRGSTGSAIKRGSRCSPRIVGIIYLRSLIEDTINCTLAFVDCFLRPINFYCHLFIAIFCARRRISHTLIRLCLSKLEMKKTQVERGKERERDNEMLNNSQVKTLPSFPASSLVESSKVVAPERKIIPSLRIDHTIVSPGGERHLVSLFAVNQLKIK